LLPAQFSRYGGRLSTISHASRRASLERNAAAGYQREDMAREISYTFQQYVAYTGDYGIQF
jgi:hypothetical protein